MRTVTRAADLRARQRRKETIKQRLWDLYNNNREFRDALVETLKTLNGKKGDSQSFGLLDQLLNEQPYRLAFWRTATEVINYRRFFDISDLVGVRTEDTSVFAATHALILRLIKEGKVTGLRIDHIDGLYDPSEYLRRLQACIASKKHVETDSPGFYLIVEKILTEGEVLPEDWAAYGTTGYDFLNALNTTFVERKGFRALEKIYARFVGFETAFEEVSYACKKLVMEELFAGELDALAHHLFRLAAKDRHSRDLPATEFAQALTEITASLPVYRTYLSESEAHERDLSYMERAFKAARARIPEERVSRAAFEFLQRVLTLNPPEYVHQEKDNWLNFLMRWQQFTGRVTAKGVEDTALYVHNPLTSLNEVGGQPKEVSGAFDVGGLHRRNRLKLRRWPFTLNATSTHDSKRSEDVRARINVLSELPTEWEKHLLRWSRWNRAKKQRMDRRNVPDKNVEMLLYQTLIGSWPLEAGELCEFQKRIKAYMLKAVREAKEQTSWVRPDKAYEGALERFVDLILEDSNANKFLQHFKKFQEKIAYYGAINSLAQLLLKITSPGAPDFYQGTELWDFSLVDPDNRRPVDFRRRGQLLKKLKRMEKEELYLLLRELMACWADGRIKLYLTWKVLSFRRSNRDLFLNGAYTPLRTSGDRKENVCAFARWRGGAWVLAAVPLRISRLRANGRPPVGKRVWRNTSLLLPSKAPDDWRNVLTGESLKTSREAGKKVLPLERVFCSFPVALLAGESA